MQALSPHPAAAVPDAAPVPADAARQRRHLLMLLGVTLLPLLGLPLLAQLQLPFRQSLVLGVAVFVGGVGHVASTMYFYADRDARTLMRGMKARFVLLPLAGLLFTATAVAFGGRLGAADDLVLAIFFAHLVWLYYHYQKQNWGLLAFAAAGSGVRLPRSTMHLLMLPPLAGGLATIPQLLADGLARPQVPLAAWLPLLHALAWVVYGGAALAFALLALRHRALFGRPWVAAFAGAGLLFFLPALLLRNLDYAFWSYALAHGFQYLLMVGLVSRGARVPWGALAALLLATLCGGWVLHRLAGTQALFVAGIVLTWVHFLLDARLWRMSEPGPRAFLRARLGHLLSPPGGRGA